MVERQSVVAQIALQRLSSTSLLARQAFGTCCLRHTLLWQRCLKPPLHASLHLPVRPSRCWNNVVK
eukprot:4382413-Amphidinium_carterae.1